MTFAERAAATIRAHQRPFVAVLIALSVMLWGAAGASAWFVRGVVTGLPDAADIREIAAMAKATTLYDGRGRASFTIYKEQRIPVAIDQVSSYLRQKLTGSVAGEVRV